MFRARSQEMQAQWSDQPVAWMDWSRGRHDGVGGEKQQRRYCQDVQPNGKCLRFGRRHGVENAICKPMFNCLVWRENTEGKLKLGFSRVRIRHEKIGTTAPFGRGSEAGRGGV